ncbi:uncharacterized protein LOC111073510, partial [Drosophila obscura]|uniref:uncharacterized protein LOC111073510 n=1 Tax=Drosophila obscura TaxID=7282 RepID=UPI001BB17CFF
CFACDTHPQKVIREPFHSVPFAIVQWHIKEQGFLAGSRTRSSALHRHGSSRMLWFPVSIAALALLCLASGGGGVGIGVAGSRYGSDDGGGYEDMEEQEQPDRSTSKMLSALFGFGQATPHPTETAAAMPHQLQLPAMYYDDFYEDLLTTKRNDVHHAGCDCKVTNVLLDLGTMHFPRYLMNAVCESRPAQDAKCTHGSNCRPLEYKVKVLTQATVPDRAAAWMNKERSAAQMWQFETVTVTAGCFCAKL